MNIQNKLELTEQIDSFEIYEFITEEQTLYYTSYIRDISHAGNLYIAVPIKRSGFTKDIDRGIAECTISAPITEIFTQYITLYPLLMVKVKIKSFFVDDLTEFISIFNGTIKSINISRKNRIATVQCVSSTDELNTKIPFMFVQSTCNNTIYDTVCGLKKETYSRTYKVTLDSNNKTKIILQGTPPPTGYYTNGIIEFQKEKRYITLQEDNICYIQIPFANLQTNDNVTLVVGCDKTKETCLNVFNNIENFTGMPYVKGGQNPYEKGIL